jgi:hypothetical protein
MFSFLIFVAILVEESHIVYFMHRKLTDLSSENTSEDGGHRGRLNSLI